MTAITHGDVGDTWVPQATFTVGGVATDPTTVTVKTRDAAGTVTTVGPVSGATGGSGIVRASQGVFTYVVSITASGYWACNFTGTGNVTASEDYEFIADPSAFTANYGLSTRALVGVQETKDWLNQQNVDTSGDLDLVRVINDVSDRIIEEAGREFKVFGTNPLTRLFDLDEVAVLSRTVFVGDLTSYTAVLVLDADEVLEQTAVVADVTDLPRNRPSWAPIRSLRLPSAIGTLRIDNVVSVAGTWGFPSVPGNIRQACLDGVAATLDRDVEFYRQDLAPGAGNAPAVVQAVQRPIFLSLPASVLAVAWGYRDLQVA